MWNPDKHIWLAHIWLATCLICFTGNASSQDVSDAISEKDALAKMRPVATNIQFHKDGTVQLVRVSKPHVNDMDLVHLRAFRRIGYLAIVHPGITDDGLAHIAELENVDTLVLNQTSISNHGLKHLANMKKLERLYLEDLAIDDGAIEHLLHLQDLKVLSLRRTKISDDTIRRLEAFQKLEAVFLCGTKISDEAIPHLANLQNLRTLYVADTNLSGKHFSVLAQLPHLEYLAVSKTKIDDAAIRQLQPSQSIRQIVALDTLVSPEAVQAMENDSRRITARISTSKRSENEFSLSRRQVVDPQAVTEVALPAKVIFTEEQDIRSPDFQKHVVPLLGRLGCNSRSCHGSFQGQGGFRLSMFGYDFENDLEALTKGDDPRVSVEQPASSLILAKPTSDDDHEGGLRFEKGGWEYSLLLRWIRHGARGQTDSDPAFVRLEVSSPEIVFDELEQTVPLRVIAVWNDGSREDVTCLTRFQSNDEAVAKVSDEGIVKATGRGDTHVVAFYDKGIIDIPVIMPVSLQTAKQYPEVPVPTRIDQLVTEKLRKLGIVPSELCSDEDFLRRVSIDLIGTLPLPEEINRFVADKSPHKRSQKIDELLQHPAYVTWWTTRLCDLTGSNAGYLGNTEMAQPVAAQWRSWIQRRVQDNLGWDQIVKGIVLATSRQPGQSYEDFIVAQSRFTALKDPTDFAATGNPMPHYWYRSNQTMPAEKALTFGYTFLGLRLQCAQCHKHPYDQWSQEDFEQFTSFFTRIKAGVAPDAVESHARMQEMLAVPDRLNTAALRRQSYLRIAAEGRPIPWGEIYIEPAKQDEPRMATLLGAEQFDLNQFEDPRVPLMDWVLDKNNPYFAKAFVNRIWENYFNIGIVDPVDDLNLANPPSNRGLLDYLANEFVERGYDMKWLHKEIVSSRTYQLDWRTNDTNRHDERNFSHAVIRRIPAEVAIDAILQATANDAVMKKLATQVTNRKIGQHPTSYQTRAIDYSLLIFGKPLRTTNCDCERKNSPTLLQALYIRNDEETLAALTRNESWIKQIEQQFDQQAKPQTGNDLAEQEPAKLVESLVQQAYLRTLSRLPTVTEADDCCRHIQESDSVIAGIQDVMWALLNTQEFITNH